MSAAKTSSQNKRRKLPRSCGVRVKTPAISDDINKKAEDSNENDQDGSSNEFCPLCQMPFSILRVQTRAWHMEECMAVNRSNQKECAKGVNCDSTIVNHYLKELHTPLAKSRSGLQNCCVNDLPAEFTAPIIQTSQTSTIIQPTPLISEERLTDDEKWATDYLIPSSVSDIEPSKCCEATKEIGKNCASATLSSHGCKRHNSSEDTKSCDFEIFPTVNPKFLPQAKITSFFQLTGQKSSKSSDTKQSNSKTIIKQPLRSADKAVKLIKGENCSVKRSQSLNVCSGSNNNDWNASGNPYTRRCPYYKKLWDMPFTVDAFSYGAIPETVAYFLSHFHSDHYQGLNSKFSSSIYCSQVTANLVKLKLRVNESLIHPLPLNIPRIIHGVEVTLIDANHCPGAVMFLFRYQDGRVVLHTGDFRATVEMEQHPALVAVNLDLLYLDTTYCQPRYDFPNQQEVLNFIVTLTMQHLELQQDTLIICGSYTIGKEKVFIAIAQSLNKKVWVSREKYRVIRCLEDPVLEKILMQNQQSADIHVLSMQQVNFKYLQDYLRQFSGRYSSILAFKPTGWEHESNGSCKSALQSIRPERRGSITIYGIPYSEHSSYSEMKRFVQSLKPTRVIPTVNVYGESAKRQLEILRSWIRST